MKKFAKLQYLFLLAFPFIVKAGELLSDGNDWWRIK